MIGCGPGVSLGISLGRRSPLYLILGQLLPPPDDFYGYDDYGEQLDRVVDYCFWNATLDEIVDITEKTCPSCKNRCGHPMPFPGILIMSWGCCYRRGQLFDQARVSGSFFGL